jgi:hypothetical protein
MELKFELNTALAVKCISAVTSAIGFTKVFITVENSQLAITNALVLLAITSVLFGQQYAYVGLRVCPMFGLAGKHNRQADLDMLTFEQICLFSACGGPGTKCYAGGLD